MDPYERLYPFFQVSLVVHISSIRSVGVQTPRWTRLLSSVNEAAGHTAAIAALDSAEMYLQDLLNSGLIGSFQANRMGEDLRQAYALRCRTINAGVAPRTIRPTSAATRPNRASYFKGQEPRRRCDE